MQLTKNSRFVEEYNQWKEKISRISDDAVKNELNLQLSALVNAVKKIDVAHNSFGITNPNNELISIREEITSFRKKISNKISECERAGLIK